MVEQRWTGFGNTLLVRQVTNHRLKAVALVTGCKPIRKEETLAWWVYQRSSPCCFGGRTAMSTSRR